MEVTCAACRRTITHPVDPTKPGDPPEGWRGHEIRGEYVYLCPACRGCPHPGHEEIPAATIRRLEERGLIPTFEP